MYILSILINWNGGSIYLQWQVLTIGDLDFEIKGKVKKKFKKKKNSQSRRKWLRLYKSYNNWGKILIEVLIVFFIVFFIKFYDLIKLYIYIYIYIYIYMSFFGNILFSLFRKLRYLVILISMFKSLIFCINTSVFPLMMKKKKSNIQSQILIYFIFPIIIFIMVSKP